MVTPHDLAAAKIAVINRDAVEQLRHSRPLLYRLLVEPGLTTPLLESGFGPLQSRHRIETRGNHAIRIHALYDRLDRCLELAETRLESLDHPWADIEGPLGPWLAEEGWTVEKSAIQFLKVADTAFSDPGMRPTYGRSYRLAAGPESGWVTEVWNATIV